MTKLEKIIDFLNKPAFMLMFGDDCTEENTPLSSANRQKLIDAIINTNGRRHNILLENK